MIAKAISRPEEVMRSGHSACPGCGVAMGMRMVLRALGKRTVAVVVPSCAAVISGPYPCASLGVPMFHSAFEIAAPTAAGISNALKIQVVVQFIDNVFRARIVAILAWSKHGQ